MPRAGDGTYTLPSGNPVQPGTLIESSWANSTLTDIANELNNVLTRDGKLGPTLPMEFTPGTVNAPSITFNAETGLGFYRSGTNRIAVAYDGRQGGEFYRGTFTIGTVVATNLLQSAGTTMLSATTVNGNLNVTGELTANNISTAVLNALYPVGSVYINTGITNPNGKLPGTWVKLSKGFLYPHGSPSAGSVGSTGGAATVVLTAAQMPEHSHSASTTSAGSHTHTGSTGTSGNHNHTTSSSGAHTHSYTASAERYFAAGSGDGWRAMSNYAATTGSAGAHTHTVSTTGNHTHSVSVNSGGAHTHPVTVYSTGSNAAHDNMPPYLTVYMWERTA